MNYRELLVKKMEENNFILRNMFGSIYPLKERICDCEELKYIPDMNIVSLYNDFNLIMEKCKEKSYGVFLSEASKMGYLKFEPYLSKSNSGQAMLVLKYNRYVTLFRGYHYQCSYTPFGYGSYSSASVRLDELTKLFRDNSVGESRLLKVLYYVNLIQCCSDLDSFHKLIRTNVEVIDEFMCQSTKGIFKDYEVTYEELISTLVLDSSGYADVVPKALYRVPMSDTTDLCRIKMYDSMHVGIELIDDCIPNELVFTLPDWNTDIDMKVLDDWYSDDEIEAIDFMLTNHTSIVRSLVTFALNECDIVSNFIVTYSRSKTVNGLRALNIPNIKVYDNLSSI